jgi:hypothetical protein
MQRGGTVGFLLFAGLLVFPPNVAAQSLKDRVGGHVGKELDKREQPRPKPKKKKRRRDGGGGNAWHPPPASGPRPAEPAPPPEPEPKGPQVPHRVIGGPFKLDPEVSVAYRGWRPQRFPSADVSTENAATWSIGAKASFYFLSITRAHYESNSVGSPRRTEASVAEKVNKATPVAAWFLGAVGFPVNWVLEPMIRYEARSFQSTLTPEKPIRIIPRSASEHDDLTLFPATTNELLMTSSFETLVVGLKYHHDNDPSGVITAKSGTIPRIYFGLGLTQYSKPYMVRVGDAVLDDLLFDAILRGGGIALGLETAQKPDRFFVDLSTQLGIGEVQLTDDFTVNETLPEDWLIGYAQGDLTAGYIHPLLRTRPSLLLGASASVGGATFFYFKPLTTEEEQTSVPPLNWDLLWGLRVFLVLPL